MTTQKILIKEATTKETTPPAITTTITPVLASTSNEEASLTLDSPQSDEPVKMPKDIESHASAAEIEDKLFSDLKPLWSKGEISVPHLSLTPKIEKKLSALDSYRKLEKGIETIEKLLIREKNGLKASHEKNKTTFVRRISRVLIITNDGTERFYRMCDALMRHHEDRLLCIELNCSSSELSEKLFNNAEKQVKALLISDKTAVSDFLLSII